MSKSFLTQLHLILQLQTPVNGTDKIFNSDLCEMSVDFIKMIT